MANSTYAARGVCVARDQKFIEQINLQNITQQD